MVWGLFLRCGDWLVGVAVVEGGGGVEGGGVRWGEVRWGGVR